MSKQLAHKKTKLLRTEAEIREHNLNSGEFTPNWQGRLLFLDTTRSTIAKELDVEKNGEYAIKTR